MKNIQFFASFVIILLFSSCTQKDKYENYKLFVKNNSGQELNIIGFEDGIETTNIVLQNSDRGLQCSFEAANFAGYGMCDLDSIKFSFPNGKGYICSIGDDSLCFGDVTNPENSMAPWYLSDKFINISGDTYEFTITEEDYNSALDLPN